MGKRVKKQRIFKMRKTVLALVILAFGVGIGVLFTPIFHVEGVLCEGNNRISQEEIIAAAQVNVGKNILTQRLSAIKKRVAEIPMVEEVRIRRVFPDQIKIWVQECVPAAYVYTDKQCVMIDTDGKILEIIDDERVAQMVEAYTPKKVKKSEEKDKSQNNEDPAPSAEPMEAAPDGEQGEEKENSTQQDDADKEAEDKETENKAEVAVMDWAYPVPLVVGLELEKPVVGKKIDSKERQKLNQVMETFGGLEKAELLVRSTYLDVTDLNDVMLVIEKRLEIKLGNLENIAYRCQFLGTVIREKLSKTEHASIDYREGNLYVRPPEDGKERMIPKPTATPIPTESAKPKATQSASAKPSASVSQMEMDGDRN